jgi:lipoprotein-releasing system permease protein
MGLVPYEAKSWSREFPIFLDRLRMQSATAYLISAFSLVASSFAIASILIVSVLQKSKQIGILKAIGARRRQILRIFILEGFGIALAGSTVGATIGTLIIYLLGRSSSPLPGSHEQFFRCDLARHPVWPWARDRCDSACPYLPPATHAAEPSGRDA